MKSIIKFYFVFFLLINFSCSKDEEETSPPPPPPTGTVSGIVSDEASSVRLENANVTLFNADNNEAIETI